MSRREPKLIPRQIIAMRNVMIHGYDEVVDEVIWVVATKDIPELRQAINVLL